MSADRLRRPEDPEDPFAADDASALDARAIDGAYLTVADGVALVLAQKDDEIAHWRLHAARWEDVARALGAVLAPLPDHADTFRTTCLTNKVTP